MNNYPSTVFRSQGRPRFVALAALAIFGYSLEANAQDAVAPGAPPPVNPAPAEIPAALPAEPAPVQEPQPIVAPPAAAPVAPQAPAPAANPSPQTSDAAAAAEAAALEAELTANALADNTSEGPRLNIYGFADFTFSKQLTKSQIITEYESFAVGNLNLYLNAELGDNWRSLSEVRFTYLPHGSTPIPSTTSTSTELPPRTDTTAVDYADLNRPMRVGGIEIERAWLEYAPHQLINVRVGQWLTPYGIWNVDHGTPVIIGVRRPYIIGESLFPERQTGIEAYGAAYVDATKIGYHLTLSNGRGPIDAYQDLDHNKAIGARVYVNNDSLLGNLTLGVAGYRGKFTDRKTEMVIQGAEAIIKQPATLQYDELSLAVDVKWEWMDLLVQGEAIMNDIAYNDRVRPADLGFTGGPPGWVPDNRRYGLYGLAAYRTPLANLMPFFGGEVYELGQHSAFPTAVALWGGLNMRPTPSVVLKAQYTRSWFPGDVMPMYEDEGANIIDLQAAWSF